jgi:hypothetical protein
MAAVQKCKLSATTLPASHSPACLGGGCVTFQQGHHGSWGGRFGGRGLQVYTAGPRSAGGGAGGNCPYH